MKKKKVGLMWLVFRVAHSPFFWWFLFSIFHPFSELDVVFRMIRWPSQGCCKYQDSLSYERQVGKKLANQGLLTKHVPPPACSLLDIFGGDYKPLMSGHRPSCATVLLFWTPWSVPTCLLAKSFMSLGLCPF